ncbi:ribosomal uS15-like protein [Fragilaria crotonensis]|nr:ribosomal uS15-like protein [Fragilaria crotonensis]
MAVSKNTLLAVLLLALNNNVAAFVPVTPRATQLSRQQAPLPVALDIDEVSAEDDSIPPEDYIVNVGDLESEDDEDGISDDGEPPSWYASAERIAALRLEHRRHEGDTGSPEYQIAGMTERINYLTSHLKLHPGFFDPTRPCRPGQQAPSSLELPLQTECGWLQGSHRVSWNPPQGSWTS